MRLAIILGALVIIGAAVARWWFWSRVKLRGQRMECSMSVAELYARLGVKKRKPSELRDAAALGAALRDAGLRLMEQEGAKPARRRRTGWWNLKILPMLLVMILAFSFFQSRFKPMWILAAGALLIGLHVVLRVAGIGVELAAVKRGWKALEEKGGLRRMDEAEAVLRCARASVWDTVLPW